jgi:hypothetical protein
MADGLFYNDMREPFLVSDIAPVTMAATAKALYPAADFPQIGPAFFNRVGKVLRIRAWLKLVLGSTPGNFSFNVHWGTGADANGTLVCVAGTPVALTQSVTKCGYVELVVRCLTTGTAGTLQAIGMAWFDPAIIASTLQPIVFPAGGGAASGALDLTSTSIVSLQVLQSGTAGTIQVQELEVTSPGHSRPVTWNPAANF